jgi:hypothetical protein
MADGGLTIVASLHTGPATFAIRHLPDNDGVIVATSDKDRVAIVVGEVGC